MNPDSLHLARRAFLSRMTTGFTGVALTHGTLTSAGRPKLAPAPMCDYLTGYLAAYGAMLALGRRSREGGSYHVQVSLCQSAMFYQRQGLLEVFGDAPGALTEQELAALYVQEDAPPYGDLLTLGPVLQMSETPCRWALPTPLLGGDPPVWT